MLAIIFCAVVFTAPIAFSIGWLFAIAFTKVDPDHPQILHYSKQTEKKPDIDTSLGEFW